MPYYVKSKVEQRWCVNRVPTDVIKGQVVAFDDQSDAMHFVPDRAEFLSPAEVAAFRKKEMGIMPTQTVASMVEKKVSTPKLETTKPVDPDKGKKGGKAKT